MSDKLRPMRDSYPLQGPISSRYPSFAPDEPVDSNGIGLGDIWRMVRSHWYLPAIAMVLCGAAAAYFIKAADPTFRAGAVVRFTDARRALTSGLESEVDQKGTLINPLLSQIQLLRSRRLIGMVVDSAGLRLQPDYSKFKPRFIGWVHVAPEAPVDSVYLAFAEAGVAARYAGDTASARYGDTLRLPGLSMVITARPAVVETAWPVVSREKAIDRVLDHLEVAPRAMTNVVDVEYVANRPAVAQRVVNTLVQSFQGANVDAAREQSRRRRIFLEEQLRQADSLQAVAQRALSDFRSRSQLYNSEDKLLSQQRDLMSLDVRRAEMDADRRVYQTLLGELENRQAGDRRDGVRALVSAPEIGTNPVVAQLYGEYVRFQRQRDSLTTGAWRSTGTNPDVRKLDDLIQTAEQQLVSAVRSHISLLNARVGSLDQLRNRSAANLSVMPAAEAEQVRLAQQVETIRTTGDQLRQDYQKARMAEAVELGQVEIIDLAPLPAAPIPQMRFLKLFVGLFLGLVLGCGAAFARERMNTSIRRRDDLETALRVPGLGLIPKVVVSPVEEEPARRPFAGMLSEKNRPAKRQANAGGLVTLDDGVSAAQQAFMEAYRVLRTNLLFSRTDRPLKSIVITSALPGEGKTTTAGNLAVSFAREGLRVLLVDCDIWRGRLHRHFGVPKRPGLVQFLAQRPTSWESCATSVEGLFVLPNGSTNKGQASLLRGTEMRRLIEDAKRDFDLIVLDTPPVLSVADPAMLGAIADGVLLVVRAGETQRAAARQALRQLDAVGANVLGAVLNDPTGRVEEAGYYAYASPYVNGAAN